MWITAISHQISTMKKSYARHYNEASLQQKLRKFAIKAGQKVVYTVLLLYYLMKSPETPFKTKASIAAALGYFILPFDFFPDLIPLFGFTDDLSVLLFTLVRISSSITPEIKIQARHKMAEWFKKVDEEKLVAIDGKIQAKN
jgi:uncharacterized membrane protein YkvA (DUF1232 family)